MYEGDTREAAPPKRQIELSYTVYQQNEQTHYYHYYVFNNSDMNPIVKNITKVLMCQHVYILKMSCEINKLIQTIKC